jgi:glucose-1-phosphatase
MTMTKAARLIIFDVGNVLVRHDNTLLIQRLSARCTRRTPARKMLDQVINETRYLSEQDGRAEALYARLTDEYGFSLDKVGFQQLFCSHFSNDLDMEPLLEELVRFNRVVLLANTNRIHWHHLMTNYPILRIAHAQYASHEIGTAKPDPTCYRRVLKHEGYQAHDAIFIDDKAENTAAALHLGMAAITYTGRPALERGLHAMGVRIN